MTNRLNLKVEIDSSSGFCFGVTSAIKKAEEILDKQDKLYCLGEIVHNEEEIRRLEKKGLITIDREQLKTLHGQKILFRAHGEPPSSYYIAKMNNNEIIDASCPIILKLHNKIKKSHGQDEHIFIFGKKDHPEVIGLNGQIENKAVVFEKIEDLDINKMPAKITLYSQTTRSLDEFHDIISYLERSGITVIVKDSICRAVSNRQFELKDFCRKYDKIIFVAGKHSSNGKVLFKICREQNPMTFYVSSPQEVQRDWFSPGDTVGISGATSTPMWLMEDVRQILLSY
ncbi:MAG: 4-hydroxy-3-methylbut-2-enyl diphosphate reductase [Bacteroidetes bacterium]|nr:4-hydroxy-3-methylbut-2-enyl diphosphate reductase [Bacteroidota bacterium]